MIDIARMRKDRDRHKVGGKHITESAWVLQSPEFLHQLRESFIASKMDRRTNLLQYARDCIAVGRAEYDLCYRRYDRDWWGWTDAQLSEWLQNEVRKHNEEIAASRRKARIGGAQ